MIFFSNIQIFLLQFQAVPFPNFQTKNYLRSIELKIRFNLRFCHLERSREKQIRFIRVQKKLNEQPPTHSH